MSLCIVGAETLRLGIAAFTLAWTHSVEHVAWEERWRVVDAGLELVEARVKGSGAGMDPGPDARLEGGWWVWAPATPPVPRLVLAASGATGAGWRLCHAAGCLTLGATPGAPVVLEPCAG
jgi:hypothetical protein